MKKYIDCLCLCVLLAVCCVACQEEDATAVRSGFLISLVEAPQVGVEARTVVEVDGHSFSTSRLTVTNKDNGRTVYGGEFTKEQIPAPTGTYDIKVALGEDAELGLTPYYTGKKEETITEGTKTVSVECSLANALLSVKFGKDAEAAARFDKFFSKYEVKVACGNLYVLIGENEKVYFKAGSSLTLTFKGTLKENGKDYEYIIPTKDISVEAKDHTILTLAVAPVEAGVAVEVTKAEVQKETISSTIPTTWLPKPTVSATGFDGNNSLSVVETETASASIDLALPCALQDVRLKFNFEDEQFKPLNDQEYYLLKDKELLEETLGLVLPAVETKVNGTIGLDALINKLQTNAGITTNNTITVAVQTSNNKWSDDFTCTLQCEKPTFHVSVYPGNIWTKEFTVNALMEEQVETGNYEKLSGNMTYQYSVDQTTWNNLTDLTVTGLEPGTKYYVRGMYRGVVSSDDVVELKTYGADQIPNSTLDEGYTITYPKSNNPLYTFDGGWIDTRNSLTCHTKGVNAFYVSKSSTLPIEENNSTVAHMLVIGWGENNSCAFGNKTGSVIKNISAGLICVGDYNVSTGEISAKEAYIKPTAMNFVYKATPYNDDEYLIRIEMLNITDGKETVIGDGELKSNTSQTSYVAGSLNISYKEEYKDMFISHVRILFQCGTKEDRDHLKDKFEDASVFNGYTNAYIKGSEFWLDEFSLEYNK